MIKTNQYVCFGVIKYERLKQGGEIIKEYGVKRIADKEILDSAMRSGYYILAE